MRRRRDLKGNIGSQQFVADAGHGAQHGEVEGFVEHLAQRVDMRAQGVAVGTVVAPQFLLDQLDLYPGPTVGVLRQLIIDYSSPKVEMEDLLVRLADAGVPEFASAVRRYL